MADRILVYPANPAAPPVVHPWGMLPGVGLGEHVLSAGWVVVWTQWGPWFRPARLPAGVSGPRPGAQFGGDGLSITVGLPGEQVPAEEASLIRDILTGLSQDVPYDVLWHGPERVNRGVVVEEVVEPSSTVPTLATDSPQLLELDPGWAVEHPDFAALLQDSGAGSGLPQPLLLGSTAGTFVVARGSLPESGDEAAAVGYAVQSVVLVPTGAPEVSPSVLVFTGTVDVDAQTVAGPSGPLTLADVQALIAGLPRSRNARVVFTSAASSVPGRDGMSLAQRVAADDPVLVLAPGGQVGSSANARLISGDAVVSAQGLRILTGDPQTGWWAYSLVGEPTALGSDLSNPVRALWELTPTAEARDGVAGLSGAAVRDGGEPGGEPGGGDVPGGLAEGDGQPVPATLLSTEAQEAMLRALGRDLVYRGEAGIGLADALLQAVSVQVSAVLGVQDPPVQAVRDHMADFFARAQDRPGFYTGLGIGQDRVPDVVGQLRRPGLTQPAEVRKVAAVVAGLAFGVDLLVLRGDGAIDRVGEARGSAGVVG